MYVCTKVCVCVCVRPPGSTLFFALTYLIFAYDYYSTILFIHFIIRFHYFSSFPFAFDYFVKCGFLITTNATTQLTLTLTLTLWLDTKAHTILSHFLKLSLCVLAPWCLQIFWPLTASLNIRHYFSLNHFIISTFFCKIFFSLH